MFSPCSAQFQRPPDARRSSGRAPVHLSSMARSDNPCRHLTSETPATICSVPHFHHQIDACSPGGVRQFVATDRSRPSAPKTSSSACSHSGSESIKQAVHIKNCGFNALRISHINVTPAGAGECARHFIIADGETKIFLPARLAFCQSAIFHICATLATSVALALGTRCNMRMVQHQIPASSHAFANGCEYRQHPQIGIQHQ